MTCRGSHGGRASRSSTEFYLNLRSLFLNLGLTVTLCRVAMGLENTSISKAYEEARQQRLKENEKRMADLGLIKLSKTLSESVTSASKPQKRNARPRTPKQMEDVERRRSSRVASLPAPVYREEVIDFRHLRRSYNRKFLHSGKCASNEERIRAIKEAEKIEGSLKAGHPSFIKPMLRSHVSSCFWLGLPTSFCRKYLPKNDETMVLEDEKGEECETLYIAGRTGLSGGWRGFSLDHNLDDGDALVFELVERARFKVYIVKAEDIQSATASVDTKPLAKKISNPKKFKRMLPSKEETTNPNGEDRKNVSKSGKTANAMYKSEQQNDVGATRNINMAMPQTLAKTNNDSEPRYDENVTNKRVRRATMKGRLK